MRYKCVSTGPKLSAQRIYRIVSEACADMEMTQNEISIIAKRAVEIVHRDGYSVTAQ
jgi:hypothetical protein